MERQEDYDRLSDDSGKVKKHKKYYSDRKGLTQNPIVNENLNTVSPLHFLMRVFDFCQKLLYHLRSETFQWTDSAIKLGSAYQSHMDAKCDIKEIVKLKSGITMDAADPTGKGGNTNKGDNCSRLLTDYSHVLIELVPLEYREDFKELLCRMWVTVKVYTSKESVDVVQFKAFCLETYNLILSKFNNAASKWISIPPTVHSLWELIQLNDNKGLGEFTESGLENSNKFLRFYRQNLARKNNQSANLDDCLTRLWLRSDPGIRGAAPKPYCSKCSSELHYTVSCPQKVAPEYQLPQILDDFYLSLILNKKFNK